MQLDVHHIWKCLTMFGVSVADSLTVYIKIEVIRYGGGGGGII